MKRNKGLNKKSKQKISTIQNKLWELCKQITRKTYGNVCYTCSKSGLVGSDWHTGHLFPKQACGASMKYDLRILRPQCYNCNINLGGMGTMFGYKMRQELGDDAWEALVKDFHYSKLGKTKAYDHYLLLLSVYQDLYDSL